VHPIMNAALVHHRDAELRASADRHNSTSPWRSPRRSRAAARRMRSEARAAAVQSGERRATRDVKPARRANECLLDVLGDFI